MGNETKHTPGPWGAVTVDPFEGEVSGLVVGAGEDDFVAVVVSEFGGDGSERTLANARLIAAAPDLLEAVKGAKFFMDDDFPEGHGFPVTHGYRKAYEAIRAAIAKAEGKGT